MNPIARSEVLADQAALEYEDLIRQLGDSPEMQRLVARTVAQAAAIRAAEWNGPQDDMVR